MIVNKCIKCEREAILKNFLCIECMTSDVKKVFSWPVVKRVFGWSAAITVIGVVGLLIIAALVPKFEGEIGRRTTKGGNVYCTTKMGLDDITQFITANDNDSVNQYLQTGRCVALKEGLKVTIMDTSGSPVSKVQIAYKGVKMWTYAEAVQ